MRKHSRQHSGFRSTKKGAAALISILIFTALIALMAVSVGLMGLNNLEAGFSEQISTDVILSAESCVEEAMLRLTRNSSYAGGSLSVGEVDCDIVVTGAPCGNCTIAVEASREFYTRNIVADVAVSGLSVDILTWEEID
ncbi:MAG: hypothetical protein ABIA47_04425 [bacterium]